MVKQIMGSHILSAPSLRKDADTWKVLVGSLEAFYLAGADINWNTHNVLSLPSYKWNLKNYWIPECRHTPVLQKEMIQQGSTPKFPPPSDGALTAPSLSSSVHRVLEREQLGRGLGLLTESDLHDPRLVPICRVIKSTLPCCARLLPKLI
jgi:acyl transferase domain-containing protein